MLWNLVVSVERRFKHARTGLICFGQCFSGSYCNLMKQRRQAWKEKSITGGLDRAVNKAAKAGPCAPSSSLWRRRNALHACTTARPIRSSITAASSIPSRHPPFYSTSKHKTLLSFFSYWSAFCVISRGLDNVLVQGFPSLAFAESEMTIISKRKTTGRELKSWVRMECFTQYIRVSWLEKGNLGRRCWWFPFPNLSELILCSHSVADGSSENTSIFLTFLPSLPAIVQRQVERLEYYISPVYPIQSANFWTSSRWTKNPIFVPFHFLSHKLLSKQI